MHAYPRASARATQDPAYGGLVLVGALEGRPGAPPDAPRYAQISFGLIRIALDVNFGEQKIQSYHCAA